MLALSLSGGRCCGSSAPYEPLSDAPTRSMSKISGETRSISRRVMTFAATTVVVLFLLAMNTNDGTTTTWQAGTATTTGENELVVESDTTSGDEAPLVKKHHHHTLPTALRLVDDQTGLFVYALDNPLYDRLLEATMRDSSSRVEKEEGILNRRRRRHLRQHDNIDEPPTLSLDRTTIRLREALVLSWTPHSMITDTSILALHCPPDNPIFHEAATMAQVRATHIHHGGSVHTSHHQWRIPEFTIQRQETCVFKLYTDHENIPTVMVESPILTIQDATRTPTNLHMAFTNDPSEMLLQFVTGDGMSMGIPVVRYGVDPSQLVHLASGESLTYTSDDLCQAPANQTEPGKFLEPGHMHSVLASNLELDTEYHYQVGWQSVNDEEDTVWSDVHAFRSSLAVGDTETPFSYVVYGDQGCPSNGWGEGGEFVSAMTEREVNESPTMRSVHHFGDLSYAQGAGHVWDEWHSMIQPFAASVPLMVGVGNHEYDHTAGGENGKDPSGVETPHGYMPMWGNNGEDSGGECGVPTAARFLMPQSEGSNGVFWYSHNYGMVHTIVISSEHDLSKGSKQYNWLEKDLTSVDRTVTPWLVVETHRPLYESEAAYDQTAVSIALRFEMEDLLRDHQVDVVLGGHYHMYERTCDGLYRSECHRGGPIHITIGSAGAVLDTAPMIPQPWSAHVIQQEFGYGRITVMNATAMHWEFVKAGDGNDPEAGKVQDDVWILRHR